MRIGAFIFLFGILAATGVPAGDIEVQDDQQFPADQQIHVQNQRLNFAQNPDRRIILKSLGKFSATKTANWFGEDSATRLITAEDNSTTDKSDSSDDQRGSGRIDA